MQLIFIVIAKKIMQEVKRIGVNYREVKEFREFKEFRESKENP